MKGFFLFLLTITCTFGACAASGCDEQILNLQNDLTGSWWINGSAAVGNFHSYASYLQAGPDYWVSVESTLANFDWKLGGLWPTAVSSSTVHGFAKRVGGTTSFTLYTNVMDANGRLVGYLKIVGNKQFVTRDFLWVKNLVLYAIRPDEPNLTTTTSFLARVPPTGTFIDIAQVRIV